MNVVFDNNAYSGVSNNRLNRIMDAEAARDVRPLASPVVVLELLARVCDAEPQKQRRARSALGRLRAHCADTSGPHPLVRFIADVDSQILHLLTGSPPKSGDELFTAFGALVCAVVDAGTDTLPSSLAPALEQIAEHVAARESEYVAAMKAVAQAVGLGETSLAAYCQDAPSHFVQRALAREPHAPIDPQRFAETVRVVAQFCAVGLALHMDTLRLIVQGKNIDSDANTLWDEEITCATSVHTTVGGAEVLLVTEEAKLRRAASAVGGTDRIVSLAEYERRLGL